ncbi:MAG: sigma-70 family RNA polymerase sigma factor [Alphaproteobacteria bacterium]|nr:sigma-70 family RNA polymerase sigma factor [Alphaproteobacteria bacterium]
MARAQAGDAPAYRRFLSESAGFLRIIVARTGIPHDQVEDVVQETLISVHAIRHTYDPTRPIRPWLAAIARRRAIDWRRRRNSANSHEVALDDAAHETFADPEANRDKDKSEAAAAIRRWLAELPPGQRQAVELLKLRELSLNEAAAVSGQSVGALKVATHRAMLTLRKLWKRDEPG